MARELTKKSLDLAEYYLTHPDLNYTEIGKVFGISKARVSQIITHPKVTRQFPILARRRVQSHLMPKALARYEKIITSSDNDAVAEKASARVLASENVFDGPKITVVNELSTKSIEDLQHLIGSAREVLPPVVIEGEIIPPTTQDTTQE